SALPPLRPRARVGIRRVRSLGEHADRLGEAHVVVPHHEADDVTGHATAEAVEEPTLRRDSEGRVLLLMKRAQRVELTADALQLEAAASDERRDIGTALDNVDLLPTDVELHVSSPVL